MGVKITIYLNDDLPRGIREAKIDQWSGKAACSPRNRLKDLFEQVSELRHGACIYFLIGEPADGGLLRVYVGEADGFQQRIRDHEYKKDWWQDVVIFFAPDGSLTKTSVKFLESITVERLRKAGKCVLQNEKEPALPSLPKEDISGLERFYEYAILIMPLLGYDIFIQNDEKEVKSVFKFFVASSKEKGAGGQGLLLKDGKMEVLKGASLITQEASSFKNYAYKKLKDQLMALGKIEQKGNKLVLSDDHVFDSPSAAAAVLLGRPVSGPLEWKTKEGKSLRQVLDSQLK